MMRKVHYMNKGTINWFNADKGYGFIMADDMQDVVCLSHIYSGK